jgi:hypothetical protein
MMNFKRTFGDLTSSSGLYRVWVPLHDDGKAPLISIWIDPTMTTFETQVCQEADGVSGISEDAIVKETEDPHRRTAMAATGERVAT